MKKSQQKILYLILVANLVLVGLIVLVVWQINEERIELSDYLAKNVGSQARETDLFSGSWTRLSPQLDTLNAYFLSASTTVGFLENLERAAEQTKTAMKINQAGIKDDLSLSLSAKGSFSGVNQFLTILENSPYAMRLDRVSLRLAEAGVWQGDFAIIVKTQK